MKKLFVVMLALLTIGVVITSCGSSKRGYGCPTNVH
jgi:predicted small lipoprotein YifL